MDKAYELLKDLYNKHEEFKKLIDINFFNGKIRLFNDNEFDKIKSQNFYSKVEGVNEFIDLFILGYNIGNCVGTSRQLSYSYDDVDIVSGILPILKGTLNAVNEGGHCWLENKNYIIDTSLMLIIDKSLKKDFGYIEEQRITSYDLKRDKIYQARKEFVNDKTIRKGL